VIRLDLTLFFPRGKFVEAVAKHVLQMYNTIAGHITLKNVNNKGNVKNENESVYSVSKV